MKQEIKDELDLWLGIIFLMCMFIIYLHYDPYDSEFKTYAIEFYSNGSLQILKFEKIPKDFNWFWFTQIDCNKNKFDAIQIYEILDDGSYNFITENRCTLYW